jgi:MinD-like ATPase involved in chromosome partitioning or flagellar assembly
VIALLSHVLTAMTFAANPDLISFVNRMCCETQDISLYRTADRYPQAREAMQLLNSYAPQLLFLEIDNEEVARALASGVGSFQPSLTIVGVSNGRADLSQPSAGFGSLQIVHQGCDLETFRTKVQLALEARAGQKNAPVFAFLPSKAGSGATTTALFVSDILSRMVHKRVLLLECDLHAGPVSMLYKIRPEFSIMDALEDSHRLTDESWQRLATSVDGIDVLPSVSQQGVRHVSPWAYQRLLAFARSRYDLIICDLPEVVNEATEVVVRAAKAVMVVTTPSVPSLRLAARRRHDLESRGVGAAKVKYILSRRSDSKIVPGVGGQGIEADRIADIPVDENLYDASEFNPSAAKSQTVAECVKIAEFCSGGFIRSNSQPRCKKFFASGWFHSASRTPQLSTQPTPSLIPVGPTRNTRNSFLL